MTEENLNYVDLTPGAVQPSDDSAPIIMGSGFCLKAEQKAKTPNDLILLSKVECTCGLCDVPVEVVWGE